MTVEQSSAVTTPDWGYLRYRVAGKDVTYVRGTKTQRGPMTLTEPYGEEAFALTFPKVTNWDVAAGTYSWLRTNAKVRVDHHDADMAYVKTLGVFKVTDIDVSDGQATLICQGLFAVNQAFRQNNPSPLARRNPRDIGLLAYRTVQPKSLFGKTRQTIGVTVRDKGSKDETSLDYLDALLDAAWDTTGDWTIGRIEGRRGQYELRRKDLTTQHITVSLLPGSGVKWNLRTDLAARPNVVYGQWETPTGSKGRNVKYMNVNDDVPTYTGPYAEGDTGEAVNVLSRELWTQGYKDPTDYRGNTFTATMTAAVKDAQRAAGLPRTGVVNRKTWDAIFLGYGRNGAGRGAVWAPLAFDPRIPFFSRSPNGSVRGYNPLHDKTLMRVETWVDYGAGITRRQAVDDAQRLVDRFSGDPVWVGTVTLDGIDPPEMHRLDIREGMNVRLVGIPGEPLAHISKVTQGPEDSPSVTLEVDTAGRNHVSVARIIARDRDGNQPVRNRGRRVDRGGKSQPRRTSKLVGDRYPTWDEESGSGDIRVAAKGGRWVVKRVLGGVVDAVTKADFDTAPNRAFVLAMFGRRVTPQWLNRWVGDPTEYVTISGSDYRPFATPNNVEKLANKGLIVAWGGPDQLAGYSPGEQSSGHPITGNLADNGVWHCESQRVPYVWVAVWSVGGDTTVTGTVRVLDQP